MQGNEKISKTNLNFPTNLILSKKDKDEIEQLKRNSITLIDSPEIVSKKLKEVLGALSLLNSSSEPGTYSFYVSDYTVVFEQIAQLMFGKNIHLQEQNIWK